jgi:hypothetical protein
MKREGEIMTVGINQIRQVRDAAQRELKPTHPNRQKAEELCKNAEKLVETNNKKAYELLQLASNVIYS